MTLSSLTFIAGELDVRKQADLDDLPEEAQYEMRGSSYHVLSVDVHHRATDGRGRVQTQDQILLQCKTDMNKDYLNGQETSMTKSSKPEGAKCPN